MVNDKASWLSHLTINNWLRYNGCVKLDRTSMRNSVEARSPLLSVELLRLSDSMKLSEKMNLFKGKKYLRNELYKQLPKSVMGNKKRGLTIPLSKFGNLSISEHFIDYLHKNKLIDLESFKRERNLSSELWLREEFKIKFLEEWLKDLDVV